jgi:hypothetical protein
VRVAKGILDARGRDALGSPVQPRCAHYVQAGFLKPDRGARRCLTFSFQDVVVLRTASELVRSRIAPSRVKKILRKLANDLPEGRSLSGLTIVAEGNRVVVRSGASAGTPRTISASSISTSRS